ncbi:hypothetical protein ROA7450_01536 [Roseovarius albus]|uniref:Lnb N-terminal periplasmic domain-containing protein n=1 Tax=Roseovarius albus TaxID=1247867 RepID=A0A1X6YY61_9RHOB|nr:DUF4105 domain-containing protein [Roseovarius albus]SLN34343.1 hypothetical protein ROA7450_01536 [Roseovarius albus]
MLKVLKVVLKIVLVPVVAVLAVWCGLALWYQFPGSEILRNILIAGIALTGLATMVALFTAKAKRFLTLFAVAFAAVALWWNTIEAPSEGNWAPDVSRQVTGEFDGDLVTLTNVREFGWRTKEDFDAHWTTRTFDLSKLETLDVFMSYWSNQYIAHILVSFGFSDGEHVVWSVEVRRRTDSGYSPVADFFKEHTLVTVASVEQDIAGLRTNIREEDVQLYRTNIPPSAARGLFEQYVSYSNELAEEAKWYNSIFTNCTTVIYFLLESAGIHNAFDWRILVNGYLPEYFYDRGIVQTGLPIDELRELGRIAPKAKEIGLTPAYYDAVRVGVPTP